MAMGIKRINNVDSYLDDEKETDVVDVYETEDEDEAPVRSSVVQEGWGQAQKAAKKAAAKYAKEFRIEDEVSLIKFLSSEPMSFPQHWVNRTAGKRSFICPTTPNCPLCRAGNTPESKFAFSVANLSGDEDDDLSAQLLVVGVRLLTQLGKLNDDPKTGPLDRQYWAVSKSGEKSKTTYSVMMVKDRDLAEDWDIDPADVAAALKKLKPLGPDSLRPETIEELKLIAREIPED
jgi:hypothetical protein